MHKQIFTILSIFIIFQLLDTTNAQPTTVFNCTIDSVLDQEPADATQCEAGANPGKCSLRNAIAMCNEALNNLSPRTCTIDFPIGKNIILNDTLGEMIMRRAVGSLFLNGNGCSVTTPLYSGLRFLTIFDPVSIVGSLDFYMSNIHLSHFGNDTVNGGALLMRDTQSSTLRNVTFANNHAAAGAAVTMERNSAAIFENVIFIDNLARGDGGAIQLSRNNDNIVFRKCTFIGNIAEGLNRDENPGRGGGLFIDVSNAGILIVDSLFEFNYGLRGASVCVNDRNIRVTFLRVLFQHNVASIHSGAVYTIFDNTDMTFADSTFFNNSAADGPAIRSWTGNDRLVINNCNFSNNHASSEGGALFFYSDNRDITVINSTFERNTARVEGGAIYIDSGNVQFEFTDCLFSDNSARRGGGLYVGSVNGEMSFTRVVLERNVAFASYGGGISFVSLNNGLNFIECSFIGNKAVSGGGIHFAMNNPVVDIDRTLFSDNTVELYGGGFYFGQEHHAIRLRNITVVNNRANSGGGVYIGQFNSVNFHSSNISFNVAVKEGGGLVSSAHDMRFVSCTISDNIAESSAGAIFTFLDNHAITGKILLMYDCVVGNNHADSVGGINIVSGSNLDMRHCRIYNNSAISSDSGGITIRKSLNCSLQSTTFVNNIGDFGGAFFVKDTLGLTLSNLTFVNNKAGNGGGIYFHSVLSSRSSQLSFVDNTASNDGGAIWGSDSELLLDDIEFLSNSATAGNGAAVFVRYSTVSVTNTQFVANRASNGAGTVYWIYNSGMIEPSGLRSSSNLFIDNTALYGSEWATEGIHVVVSNTSIYVSDYTAVAPPVDVSIIDYYNETVTTESDAYIEVESFGSISCFDSTGFVTGDVIQRVERGMTTFKNLLPQCAPGLHIDATFSTNIRATTAVLRFHFRECETGEFYRDRICQPCANGSYSFVDPTGLTLSEIPPSVCKTCPSQAAFCFGNTLSLKPDYWRITETAHRILDCPFGDNACIGGSAYGNDLCNVGYVGALCAECDDGYSMHIATQTCEECDVKDFSLNPFFLLLILVVLAFTLFLLKSWKEIGEIRTIDQFIYFNFLKLGFMTSEDATNSDKEILKIRQNRLSLQTRLAIHGSFFQIVAVLPYVLDMKLPDSFSSMLYSACGFLNLSPAQAALFSCEWSDRIDFVDSLLVDTLMPIGVLIMFCGSYAAHSRLPSYRHSKKLKLLASYVKVFLVYSGIVVPYVSIQIFKTFSCQDVDPDDDTAGSHVYLRADYSVSCNSDRYLFAVVWASSAIVVYIIILPLSYLYFLHQARLEISNFLIETGNEKERVVIVSDKIQHVFFLFRNYRAEYWYWAVLDLYFRISITGFLVLIRPGSFLQIEIGFLLILTYAILFQLCNPYIDERLQALKVITLWQLFFLFHIAFLIQTDDFRSQSAAAILFVVTFGGIMMDFMFSLLHYLSNRNFIVKSMVNVMPSYLFPQNSDDIIETSTSESNDMSNIEMERCSRLQTGDTQGWNSSGMSVGIRSTIENKDGGPEQRTDATISPFFVSNGNNKDDA